MGLRQRDGSRRSIFRIHMAARDLPIYELESALIGALQGSGLYGPHETADPDDN